MCLRVLLDVRTHQRFDCIDGVLHVPATIQQRLQRVLGRLAGQGLRHYPVGQGAGDIGECHPATVHANVWQLCVKCVVVRQMQQTAPIKVTGILNVLATAVSGTQPILDDSSSYRTL